jgi:hypothetical protein
LGGLLPLMGLSEVAFVIFVAAVASAAAAGWADRLLVDPTTFASLPLEALALGLTAVVLSVAPLVVFIPTLTRVRKEGLRRYGALVHHHDRAFHARWIEGTADPLGHPDMSSLADLGSGFARVEAMRPLMLSPRVVKVVLAGTWLPFAPLVLFHYGVHELLARIIETVI